MTDINKFAIIEDTIYPIDLVKKVAIFNAGGTPAKYGIYVELRPVFGSTYNDGKDRGYAMSSDIIPMGNGKYDTYEEAQAALKEYNNELNY